MPSSSDFGGLQQDRAGPVAEKYACIAVLVIDDGAHHVAPDHQRFLMGSRADKLGADRQRIQKSRTGPGKIETPGVLGADPVLNQACRGREKHVRRDRGDDNQVDLFGARAGFFEHALSRGGGQMRCGHALIDDMPFAHPYALLNPIVGCLHHALQIGIGEHV